MTRTARTTIGVLAAAALVTVPLTACAATSDAAPESQTPADIVAMAEYDPGTTAGMVRWTVTGGSRALPDDGTVLISIARSEAQLVSSGTEDSDRTRAFLDRIGEVGEGAHVVASAATSTGSVDYAFDTATSDTLTTPRVHMALVDDETGDMITVRSVAVEIFDLAGARG